MILKNIIFLALLSTLAINTQAQQYAEIEVGDTLYFAPCDGESYKYMDLYKKSRIDPRDTFNYDLLDNWDFYNTFFEFGDFDVSRVPCEYQKNYGIVKHIMAVEVPDGTEPPPMQTIVVIMIEYGLSAAYLIESAFTEGEVFVSKRK